MKQRRADCLEAALFAIMVFKFHRIPSFLVDLESVRDEDHELCVYKIEGKYGSIAQSKFLGLKFRNPVYKTVRELVMSYFEHYFNFFGELTLRAYSIPVRFGNDSSWFYSDRKIEEIDATLYHIKHYSVLDKKKRLPTIGAEKFRKETLIIPDGEKIGKKYRI